MLQIRPLQNASDIAQGNWVDGPATPGIDLHRLLAMARRQWSVVLVGALAGVALSLAYLLVATPLYTATTTLLIDTLTARSLEDGVSRGAPVVDTLAVDSQVEVIRSQKIISGVINALDLTARPPFSQAATGTLDTVVNALPAPLSAVARLVRGEDDDRDALMRAAGRLFARNLDVRRVGRSYVLEVGYTSPDPKLSAEVANAVAAAYLRDQLEARQEAARQASVWLQQGLQEIRDKSVAADLAIQRFRDAKTAAAELDGSPDEAQVQLRELEREAESLRTLRQNLLQRFEKAAQEQSFPVAEARVIGTANVSGTPSYPSRLLFLVGAAILGAIAGTGVALLREYSDRFFRTGQQVREELDLEYLGPLPMLKNAAKAGAGGLLPARALRYAADEPLSRFAETLRTAKVAADITLQEEKPKIVGVVSIHPGEGKSTTAKNLASLIAQQGVRTLLIDGDLRQPNLTRSIAPQATAGLLNVLLEGVPVEQAIARETSTGLCFLPSVQKGLVPHSGDILASQRMRTLLRQLEAQFDYIIIDLPPLGAVVDARAAAAQFSGFLFVVEWGRTSRGAVRAMLQNDPRIRDRCLGVIFSKVPLEAAGLYDPDDTARTTYGYVEKQHAG